ncbi:hypothetical protein NECAME_12509 [Necator americanus]|uniref:Anaphylatoxin-like domain-containing protein n=1 Tax=Necator americanus TaxID=51031 RepID=W2T0I2_NECAM|nr:hypothetical protein NECAME_12509 [Necator americanus]ETN75074.1 hypothetical protein NECAME_12509 [Necator americanus]
MSEAPTNFRDVARADLDISCKRRRVRILKLKERVLLASGIPLLDMSIQTNNAIRYGRVMTAAWSAASELSCVNPFSSPTASICCLRALLDSACEEGTSLARQDEMCPSSINTLGGGLRKECCDCCLLAKDLLHKNQPCIAPTGFSAACLKSFTRCCQGSLEITQPFPQITGSPTSDSGAVYLGDRCVNAKCEHLCNDR